MSSDILLVQQREDGQWEVKREGGQRASHLAKYKKDAVKEAEKYLKQKDDVSRVLIYKKDGTIAKEKKQEKAEITTTTSIKKTKVIKFPFKNFTVPVVVWRERFSDDEKLTEEHIGERVHVAGESSKVKCYLYKVHEPGEYMWPDGGYEVKWQKKYYSTCHLYNEVRLHNSTKKKLRKKK